jgi:DNA-binding response OmpR family regulator
MDPLVPPDNTGRPRLLVIDDEAALRDALARYFGYNNFDVRTAADAQQARALIATTVPDLVVVDVNMPGESGLSLARWLREAHPRVGLVMLTGATDPVDRIVGLEVGADDYVTKPFETRELLARLRNLLRRLTPVSITPATAQIHPAPRFGLCTLDLDGRRLLRCDDGSEVPISVTEFDLLALFARHPNRPLSRDQILENGRDRQWDGLDRSVDLRVMRLRRKIERYPNKPTVLKTVRSVGYMYVTGD